MGMRDDGEERKWREGMGLDGSGDLRHHIILTLHVPYRTATVCRSHAPIFRLWLGTCWLFMKQMPSNY